MKFRALTTFAGVVSAVKGQVLELDQEAARPLVEAQYLVALPNKREEASE